MTRIPLLALAIVLLAAPCAAASSLVEVPISGPQSVAVLERLGLDVTHDVTEDRVRVVLHGEADRAQLDAAGFTAQTLVEDVEAALGAATVERRTLQSSALPSGRDAYRVLGDYHAELAALAERHPGLVRRITLPRRSIEGRELVGVEIAADVNRSDGRPVATFFGLHHAREWPSGEVNAEFALDLARGYGNDPRITGLLDRVRVFVFPVINPDGFVVSRGEVASLPGGTKPMHRRNCRPATPAEESVPCAERNPTDLNRNYGAGWGGAGASTSNTSDSYRGTGPFSEPESQAVHEFLRERQVMHVQSTHNIVGQVLRQPGFRDYGHVTPDERIMKPLGDRMAAATGYDSLLGHDLYDVHGATEDWSYIEQGAMGYTIELGPADTPGPSPAGLGTAPLFFGPYQTHVVDQYLGGGTGGPAGQGVREAFLLAAEQAGEIADHGVLAGAARAGHTLRIRRDFTTDTVRRCVDDACAASTRLPELRVPDFVESTLAVPASGRFEWHVGPSTRPWVGAAGGTETWALTCEAPDGAVVARRDIVVRRGDRLGFADACDASAPVTVDRHASPASPGTAPGTSALRVFVGPRRVRRSVLRRRGHLRVAVKARGGTARRLRVRLVDRERTVVATRSFRRLSRPKVVRLRLPRVPPRGVYRLSLRGRAAGGAPVGAAVRLRVTRR